MEPRKNEEASSRKISLRPASANDHEFLIQVYASTRNEEMASWGWNLGQQMSFVRMQFDARHRGYEATYPSAENSVISVGDTPVGSIIVFRAQNEIRLVDVALLLEFRGRGIGEELVRMLMSEGARSGLPLRLSVLRSNRAAHLYERLGFIAKGGDALYCEMEWVPTNVQVHGTPASTSQEKDVNAGKSK
jgi:ribosomal protein S18 acetylase RimI-like enzyme